MGLKRVCIRMTVVLLVLFCLYGLSALFLPEPLTESLAVLALLLASAYLFQVYRILPEAIDTRYSYILLAASCLIWAGGQVQSLLIVLQKGHQAHTAIPEYTFLLVNMLLAGAFVVVWHSLFTRRNFVQLLVDNLTILILSLLFLWQIFFRKDASSIARLAAGNTTDLMTLILDLLVCMGVFQWIVSVRSGQMAPSILLLTVSANGFALLSILQLYMKLWNYPLPTSLLDVLSVATFTGMAIGGLGRLCASGAPQPLAKISNVGLRGRWPVLLIFPASIFMLFLLNFTPTTQTPLDYSWSLLLIFLHWLISRYIQLSIENERLLALEKQNTATLEQRVAEQVKALTRLTQEDSLTSLWNRHSFIQALEQAMDEEEPLSLLLVDVDRFKIINSSYGPVAGDEVLREVARRLKEWNAGRGLLARMGADDFAVLYREPLSSAQLTNLCSELMARFQTPYKLGNNQFELSVSIGAFEQTEPTHSSGQLLQSAESALQQARSQGYGRFQIFDPLTNRDLTNGSRIELMLSKPGVEAEFQLYYQPQFALPGLELVGAESLLRWRSAEHGFIAPGYFIPLAEKSGMIVQIGTWVLREAFLQSVEWRHTHLKPLKLGVNVSPLQLDQPGFLDTVRTLLAETGADPAALDIEITETVMIRNTGEMQAVFSALRGMGFSISVDDFGSGYASLGYLSKFPFDRIKLDKSLIDSLLSPVASGALVVKSILDMSKTLGICTIAEGVEKQEQMDLLVSMGCNQLQGYLAGRPVPAGEFRRLFIQGRPQPVKIPY
ncbi:MAG: bifunctional diguanylate cyclase/phosphodiesterase [Candidatus Limiplasma sp.]|nr:bifunctional diguanylate cyclase/phosphodiesterase [Candidatus Limiplasma sp.]